MAVDPSKQNPSDPKQQGNSQSPNSDTGDGSSGSEQEVDVTEDIQKLLSYVEKKKADDPHDTVLSRIHSRMQDIVEKLVGDAPADSHNQTPTTPTVTIPDLPQWQFVRKRGGRIVKRPVKKQEAPK